MDNTSENIKRGFRAFSEHLMFLADRQIGEHTGEMQSASERLYFLIDDYQHINPWYPPKHIVHALKSFAQATAQIGGQVSINPVNPGNQSVALLLRPGAPLEGLGEVILCAISGFHCLVSLKQEDAQLFRAVIDLIGLYVDGIAGSIEIIDGQLPAFAACIGVNSKFNPTVGKYFSKHPFLQISRKGSSAILTGNESAEILNGIAEDICMYFGRSMYSIKTLFVPAGYDFSRLMQCIDSYSESGIHSRYFNHYEYRKAGMLISQIQHLDNGFLLVTDDISQLGFVGVLHFTSYNSPEEAMESDLLTDYPLINPVPASGYAAPGKSREAVQRVFGDVVSLHDFINSI